MNLESVYGMFPHMEITRETQLKIIYDGIKRLGITRHRLEKVAKVPIGTIKDLERGKRAMMADKWQKIQNVVAEKPLSELAGADYALIDTLKIILGVLTARGMCNNEYLEKALSYYHQDYRDKNLPESATVMSQLQEFVTGKPHQSEREIIGRLLHIPHQGSA
jgi:hypothetical protein